MMKYKLLFLIVLGAAIASGVMGRLRRKRSVLVEFARMIECETGRPAGEYNGYGCWCGKGGHGKPVDDVDRCCFEHDNCYGKAAKDKCTLPAQIYWQWYYRTPCSGCYSALNNKCGQALCECDGEAARCFRRSHFHLHYKRYFKEQCYENHTIV